jgi:hypothetical protein
MTHHQNTIRSGLMIFPMHIATVINSLKNKKSLQVKEIENSDGE